LIVKNDGFTFLNHRYCKYSSLLVKILTWIPQIKNMKNHL